MSYSNINFKPPEGVRSAYKQGIKLHEKGLSGKGLEASTVAMARKLASGQSVSPEWARKAHRFWSRNERFLSEPKDSPAYASAMLWGGRPGLSWYNKLYEQMESADGKGKNMKLNFETRLITNADKVSTKKINGVDHIIVKDVCHMIGNSVMNGIFYPFEEMEKLCANLQNRRIVMPAEHPTDEGGNHMSASDPLSHIDHLVGAFAYNFSIRGDKLISDMAINPSQAFMNKHGETIINAIQSGDDLDMSTGFYLDIEELTEKLIAPDGNEYDQVARNLTMDHSALLPVSPGAKRSNEGVGIRANKAIGANGGKMDLSVFVFNELAANATATAMSLPLSNREDPYSELEAINRIKAFTNSGSMPTTNYRKFFAYYDRKNPDSFEGYKFPIADIVNDKPVVSYIALTNAEKQILEAQISEDEKEEARKVIGHYKAMYNDEGNVSFNSDNMDEGMLKKAVKALAGVFGVNTGYNTNENSDGVAVVNATEGNAKMKNRMMKKLKENGYKQEDMDNMSDDEIMNAYDKVMGGGKKKENADDDKDMDDKDKPKMKGNSAEEPDLSSLIANAVAEATKPLMKKIEGLETAQNSAAEMRKTELVGLVANSVAGMTKEIAQTMSIEALETLAAANGHTNFNVGETGMPVVNNNQDDGFANMQMPNVAEDN